MVAMLQASLLAGTVAVAVVMSSVTPGGSCDLHTNLTAWASSIDFRSGDELVFKYDASARRTTSSR
jgi:hypothetical protein